LFSSFLPSFLEHQSGVVFYIFSLPFVTSSFSSLLPTMSIFYQALTSTPIDDLETPTSEEQEEVESTIQSILLPYQQSPLFTDKSSSNATTSSHESSSFSASTSTPAIASASTLPVPILNKSLHMAFLRKVLNPLPAPYVAFDSTRCWLIYWVAHSHYLMGTELPESVKSQAISTLLHFQDKKTGGFGSGQGQIGHLMATYASVMALAVLGGPGPCPDDEEVKAGLCTSIGKGGWGEIDR
jgi:protein farnesyltransferase subunit beta